MKEIPWHVLDKWCASQYNWAEEVRDLMPNLPSRVYIRDVTCREGTMMLGVSVTVKDKVKIAKKLEETGVHEIELPPIVTSEDFETVKAIKDAGVKIRKSVMASLQAKDWKTQVDRAIDAGADSIKTKSFYTSDWLVKATGVSREEIISNAIAMIKYTHEEYGAPINAGCVDATRTNLDTLIEMYKQITDAGADILWLADTLGVAVPSAIRYLTSQIVKEVGDTPIAIHCHNELGLAMANSLAAVEGGAQWVDVTVNGLGVGAGHASLEEVVMGLEMGYGIKTNIKLEKLFELSTLLEELSGVKCQPHKAIVGRDTVLEIADARVIDILTQGRPREWQSWYAYKPEVVGRKHQVAWTAETIQEESVKTKLDQMGLRYTKEDLSRLHRQLTEEVRRKTRKYITEKELELRVKELLTP